MCRSIDQNDLFEYFKEKNKKCLDLLPTVTEDIKTLFTK